MVKRPFQACRWLRANLSLAVAALALSATSAAMAQGTTSFAPEQPRKVKAHVLPERLPDKPSLPPTFSIPVESLGFTAPGAIYLGQRFSLVSLDFLAENRLLFTFRVPGLIHRENPNSDQSDERQIRALVLTLPEGAVESEALWTVHDRWRYVWMLNDGHFLLRDRDSLRLGDRTLTTKLFLRFPGPLLGLELDPTQQFLVTNSREPASAEQKPGNVGSPPTAEASMTVNGEKTPAKPASEPDTVVRILRRDSGQVMLVSRVRSTIHLPINSDGYLETLRGNESAWFFNLNYFRGGSTLVGKLDSSCFPTADFISQKELLATTCTAAGGHNIVAMSTDGHLLWEAYPSAMPIWPIVTIAPDGPRLVRETLAVNHPVSASNPIDSDDIKGQLVEVLDASDGQLVLTATASPVFDAGGNVAISASGRRVAVLSSGTIQVFDLPVPPPLPAIPQDRSSR